MRRHKTSLYPKCNRQSSFTKTCGQYHSRRYYQSAWRISFAPGERPSPATKLTPNNLGQSRERSLCMQVESCARFQRYHDPCTTHRLQQMFITKWLTSVLCQRKQRVNIGSVKSNFTTINASVPQGTIFGPIGVVHHTNNLRTTCDHVKYVDDCTIWDTCTPSCVNSSLQTAADEVAQWVTINNMALKYDKTKEMRSCLKKETPDIPPITINDIQIE